MNVAMETVGGLDHVITQTDQVACPNGMVECVVDCSTSSNLKVKQESSGNTSSSSGVSANSGGGGGDGKNMHNSTILSNGVVEGNKLFTSSVCSEANNTDDLIEFETMKNMDGNKFEDKSNSQFEVNNNNQMITIQPTNNNQQQPNQQQLTQQLQLNQQQNKQVSLNNNKVVVIVPTQQGKNSTFQVKRPKLH